MAEYVDVVGGNDRTFVIAADNVAIRRDDGTLIPLATRGVPAGGGGSGGAGEQGPPGADGKDGTDGTDGEDGATGPMGPPGPAGADGKDGINGTNGKDGATGATGPIGPTGATGPQGPPGPAATGGSGGLVEYVSADITWANGATYTITHGLGVVPHHFIVEGVAQFALYGIPTGGLVCLSDMVSGSATSGYQIRNLTATTVDLVIAQYGMNMMNATGASTSITSSQVKIRVRVRP
jgi:hypothetical protein